jgi:hypothetical protein
MSLYTSLEEQKYIEKTNMFAIYLSWLVVLSKIVESLVIFVFIFSMVLEKLQLYT